MLGTHKLRVGVVHAEVLPIPPVMGGAIGQTIFDTVVGMPDVDWTVISRWDDVLSDLERDARFHYVDIDARLADVRRVFAGREGVIQSDLALRQFCYVDGVIDLLKGCDCDVIQIHNRPQFLPYIKKNVPNKKFVLYMHNEADYDDVRVKRGIGLCDKLVCVSHYLAQRFGENFPMCKNKTVVIHNSVDASFWHPKLKTAREAKQIRSACGLKEGATVLFVGRTVPNKGLHCLVEAMLVVRQQMPQAHLLVVGSPLFFVDDVKGYLKRLKRRAQKLGDGVTFVGFVERQQLRYYYAVADVVVVPSLWAEPFGKVIVEAMSVSVPVVASHRGGIPEILTDQKDGVLVNAPKDAQALAKQILALLNKKKHRLEMGRLGRLRVKTQFGPELRYQKLRDVYRDVV